MISWFQSNFKAWLIGKWAMGVDIRSGVWVWEWGACQAHWSQRSLLPDRMFVMVAGKSIALGLWVVIPTSIEPDHLSTRRSSLIWKQNQKMLTLFSNTVKSSYKEPAYKELLVIRNWFSFPNFTNDLGCNDSIRCIKNRLQTRRYDFRFLVFDFRSNAYYCFDPHFK